jgi:hypothetical protein
MISMRLRTRSRLYRGVGLLGALVAVAVVQQVATADTTVLNESVWNTVGWTPLPDPTDLSMVTACATHVPWKVTIEAVMESDGQQYEHIALVKPGGKCAEKFFGEQVSIVDGGYPPLPSYSTSGSYSATQYVNYGEIPPIEVRAAVPADATTTTGRASVVTFEAKTMIHQNVWDCMYSTWTAGTGTQPHEVNVRESEGDGVTGC